jgi:hypothetical protein
MATDGRIEAQFTVPASTTISATTNAGGPTTVTLTAGTYYMSTFVAQLQADLIAQRTVTAGTWTVSLSTGANGTGKVTIAVTNGTFSITWTSTNARDILGFTADIAAQTSSTGASQARGVWIPDRPLKIKSTPNAAPKRSDKRGTVGPTGVVFSLVGNKWYEHVELLWRGVAKNRVWVGAETTTNQSWEKFMLDTQLNDGHSWFTVGSKIQIYDILGAKVGIYGNSGSGMAGWYMHNVDDINPMRSDEHWDGAWDITIPKITTDA